MSGDGQRWRVLLAEGGRSFRIEVDTGAGFRLATVVEVDQALKLTTYQAPERSAERGRNVPRNTKGRIPDFPVTRSHPPASWPSAANSSICRTYRKTAGEESRRRSPVANRWMRP